MYPTPGANQRAHTATGSPSHHGLGPHTQRSYGIALALETAESAIELYQYSSAKYYNCTENPRVERPNKGILRKVLRIRMIGLATLTAVGLAVGGPSRASSIVSTVASVNLASRAREWVLNDGFHQPAKVELMSDSFVWFGPIVGPLNKQDFLGTVGSFAVWEGFPDMRLELSEFTQDPVELNRYWGILRLAGTHLKPLNSGTPAPPYPATGNLLDVGPQAVSVTFDDDGLVSRYTGGYIVDRRQGATGEFGGVFAFFKVAGGFLPPPRLAKLLNWVGSKMKNFPKNRSHRDDLPAKWKDLGRTHGLRTEDAWDLLPTD